MIVILLCLLQQIHKKTNSMNEFLSNLFDKRSISSAGTNNVREVELYGAHIVDPLPYEPDPKTYRHSYYYNSKTNILYRRIVHKRIGQTVVIASWNRIS